MSADNLQLHVAICEYLQQLAQNPGKLDSDSIQVALQCLTESLEIDMEDCAGKTLADKGTFLDEVFTAGLTAICGEETRTTPQKTKDQVTEADKQQAEQYKNEGNGLLGSDPEGACVKYTQAIQLNPFNHIYWNNRAVVQFKLHRYTECVADAKESIKINDKYVKSHYRLGLAYVELKKYNDAIAAFGKAKTIAQANGETAIVGEIESDLKKVKGLKAGGASSSPSSSHGSQSRGNAAGNPFGGLDLGALMNNPMIAQMAQSFMANMGQGGGDMSAALNAAMGGGAQSQADGSEDDDDDYDDNDEEDSEDGPAQQPGGGAGADGLGGNEDLQRIMREVQANPMAAMQYIQNPEIMAQIQAMLGGAGAGAGGNARR